MTTRREAAHRQHAFRTRQLEEFYGPLLSMRQEIQARSELRVKLQQAVDQRHFVDLLGAAPSDVDAASDAHLPTIIKNIQDESQTFKDTLMPRYREMINTFREKMWLAEPETRGYFRQLIEFVDVWDKILDERLPGEVALEIGHTEQKLKPFYSHLEEMHDRLRRQLKA
jgi:hypothetical protein